MENLTPQEKKFLEAFDEGIFYREAQECREEKNSYGCVGGRRNDETKA